MPPSVFTWVPACMFHDNLDGVMRFTRQNIDPHPCLVSDNFCTPKNPFSIYFIVHMVKFGHTAGHKFDI